MKFKCDRSSLLRVVSAAGRAVSTRTTMGPALTGLRFVLDKDELTVTGSDLDMTITMRTEVAGGESGQALIPAKLLGDVVRVFPEGALEIEVSDKDAVVKSGKANFKIRVLSVDDWPTIPTLGDGGDVTTSQIDAEELQGALEQVVDTAEDMPPADDESDKAKVTTSVQADAALLGDALDQATRAASTDETRPLLTGVLMAAQDDGLRMVATDSYRLAMRDLGGSSLLADDKSVLIPSRALKELRREIGDSKEVTLRLSERTAEFSVESMTLSVRLIEGTYPNYERLIPESYNNVLEIDREEFLEAARRMRLLTATTNNTPIELVMSEGSVELKVEAKDVGSASESIAADYKGEEMSIAFNAAYLTDGLEITSAEKIRLESTDPLKPAVMRPVDDKSFLYLLMPVRVT